MNVKLILLQTIGNYHKTIDALCKIYTEYICATDSQTSKLTSNILDACSLQTNCKFDSIQII